MCSLEPFKIDLKGLEQGRTAFEFQLHDSYFEAIEAPNVRKGELCVSLTVFRTDNCFELNFHTEGSIHIPCDLCLDDMELAIDTDNRLVAQLGEEYSEQDELVTVDENEGMLDTSWFIYEFIELDIPLRHVHAPGKCNPAMMKVLEEHSASRRGAANEEQQIDPRWAALLNLKMKD